MADPIGTAAIGAAATVVLQRLGIELGKFLEPYHEPRRRAASRLQDELDMRSKARVEDDIERERLSRAAAHLYWQEGNLEDITYQFTRLLPEETPTSNAESIDAAWISVFRDNAKHSSDEEAQNMWARVLAGEATQPGSISKRTLSALGMLSKREAELFSVLCGMRMGASPSILLFDFESKFATDHNVTRRTVMDLHEAGLLEGIQMEGYVRPLPLGTPQRATLIEGELIVVPTTPSISRGTADLPVGLFQLTLSGLELARIAEPKTPTGHREYVAQRWRQAGHQVQITP